MISIILMIIENGCTCAPPRETIRLDGSSTVFVISEAIAEEYKKKHHGNISIAISGTGGGFKKLCSKRIDVIGASRAITKNEKETCEKNGVDVLELEVAYDGIVIAVNKANSWVHQISVDDLKRIFEPAAEGVITKWSDINKNWPARKFEIFTPGISSGTYDYFTKAVVGKEHSSRGDMTTSEDDNVLVIGIRSNIDSIGFFSYAFFAENRDTIKALAVSSDDKTPIIPSETSIRSGTYKPLSRPLYLYANRKIEKHYHDFLRFYLENSSAIAKDVGFIALPENLLRESLNKLREDL